MIRSVDNIFFDINNGNIVIDNPYVPGVAFLSGGQSEIESSKNLNEINKINDTNFLITFSYGRGLQASALKAFGKDQNNQNDIQKAFDHRAKMNGLSSKGEWSENLEKEAAA